MKIELHDAMAQRITDLFGLIYRNLMRDENDTISINKDSQSALLSVLQRTGPIKMSEIGKILKVTKPNITFLVDKMEKQGLITREKSDSDRRITNICLTDNGKNTIEERKASLHDKIAGKLDLLTEKDLEVLGQALETSFDILGKLYDATLSNDGEE